MSSNHITTCLLCDPEKPKRFACPPIPEVKPGEKPPKGLVEFFKALGRHFAEYHLEELTEAQEIGTKLTAMILLKNFHSSDPGVHNAAEAERQFIHRITLPGPHVLSNSWLQGVYRSMLEDSPTGEIRFEEFQRLRDLLLEEGASESSQVVRT